MVENAWQPTTFRSYIRTVPTSSHPALIQTDAGLAYLKAINNQEGRHILTCEWLGTKLASRFGLSTFDLRIMDVTDDDEIPLYDSVVAAPGPAVVSRLEKGGPMGQERSLRTVHNLDDIARLIVFDTWVRNCDRFGPGLGHAGCDRVNHENVFLSEENAPPGQFTLKPIDHGHILTCGRPLTPTLANIEFVRDERLYGLFPAFRAHVTVEGIEGVADELREIDQSLWSDLVSSFPAAWEVPPEVREAIGRFLSTRARFLPDRIHSMAHQALRPGVLDLGPGENGGEA